jgi:hypothetical protein
MMSYGYYGGMMDGFGWVWMVLLLAAVITLMVWGYARGSKTRSAQPPPATTESTTVNS